MAKRRTPLRMLAAALMLSVGLGILLTVLQQSDVANRDSIGYWAAGRQILSHQNPYDQAAIRGLEESAGYNQPRWPLTRNPPQALVLWMVLGLFAPRVSAIFWSLLLIAALMVSIRLLWILHGRPADRLHLVGYCFPPVLCSILAGQVGLLLLLGFTLFLWLERERPSLAGCALLLCSIKPHLFGPLVAVLVIWSVRTRRFRVLGGAAAAIAVASLLPLLFDPGVFHQYRVGFQGEGIADEFIPTVSLFFRLAIRRSAVWLQAVPLLLGVVWALAYYWRHRAHWEWREHGPLLAAVGVMVAPYAWVTDEVLAVPAVLAANYVAARAGVSLLPFFGLATVALLEVFAGVQPASGFYVWTAPAWVLWCGYVGWRVRGRRSVGVSSAEAVEVR
jgi:hypothetical protein